MKFRRTSPRTKLAYAWSGALGTLVCELSHLSWLNTRLPRSLELVFLLAISLILMNLAERLKAQATVQRGACAALGLLCTTIILVVVT